MTWVRRLLCRVFGHRDIPEYAPTEQWPDGWQRFTGVAYRCDRCGRRAKQ